MAKTSKPAAAVAVVTASLGPEKALGQLQKLLDQIPQVRTESNGGPLFSTWHQDVRGVLSRAYGRPSLQFEQFEEIRFGPFFPDLSTPASAYTEARLDGLTRAEGFLQSRISELTEELQETQSRPFSPKSNDPMSTRKVFVVHGHDHGSKEAVARYLTKIELEPVILHEQPDQGRTLIEKFEHHADVPCAVIILSPDDIAYAKIAPTAQEERARQNVIFELGFFVGRLGRRHTFALMQAGVTRPSDIDGVLYIPLDEAGAWKMRLVGELKAAGMDVDANRAFE